MTEFVLVSCSKSKLTGIHRGEDLYEPSDIFGKRRTFAEREGTHWGILSAKHGYLRSWEAVEDYERHISDRTPVWGAFVLDDLLADLEFYDVDQVTVLAGKRYVDPLVAELEARGYDVLDYNRGLRPGERKRELKEANAPGEQETLVTDGGEDIGRALVALLKRLSKGDRFTVDCHDPVLRVHSTEEFIGPVFLDAYDEDGGHWPVASVDGDLYLGYSQLEPADDQSRAKRIENVEIVDQQETPSLVPDGGEEVGRAIEEDVADALATALDDLEREQVTAVLLKQFAASKASTDLPPGLVPEGASALANLDIGFDRRVDADVLGDAVEDVVASRDKQSETGAHYTPDHVVEYINEETINAQLQDALGPYTTADDADDVSVLADHVPDGTKQAALAAIDDMCVLDPAMGSAHFLIDALTRIADVRQRVDPTTPLWQHRKRTAERNLYGVDINSLAVEIAKLRIRLTILDAVPVTEDGRPAVTPEAITV